MNDWDYFLKKRLPTCNPFQRGQNTLSSTRTSRKGRTTVLIETSHRGDWLQFQQWLSLYKDVVKVKEKYFEIIRENFR